MKNIRVTIIITATHNQDKLTKCLHAVALQIKENDEIIVVGKDPGISLLQRPSFYKDKKNFRFFPNPNTSNLREFGLKYAKGEIIAFMDDDCIISPKWLWYIRRLSNKSSGKNVFQGKIDIIMNDKSLLNDVFHKIIKEEWRQIAGQHRDNSPIYLNIFHSEIFFLKKDILNQLVNFFGTETQFLDQGTMMTVGLQLLGYKIVYFPSLQAKHFKEKLTLVDFAKKYFDKGYIAGKMEGKYTVKSKIISLFKEHIPPDKFSLNEDINRIAGKFSHKGVKIWIQVVLFLVIKKVFYSAGKLWGGRMNGYLK